MIGPKQRNIIHWLIIQDDSEEFFTVDQITEALSDKKHKIKASLKRLEPKRLTYGIQKSVDERGEVYRYHPNARELLKDNLVEWLKSKKFPNGKLNKDLFG